MISPRAPRRQTGSPGRDTGQYWRRASRRPRWAAEAAAGDRRQPVRGLRDFFGELRREILVQYRRAIAQCIEVLEIADDAVDDAAQTQPVLFIEQLSVLGLQTDQRIALGAEIAAQMDRAATDVRERAAQSLRGGADHGILQLLHLVVHLLDARSDVANDLLAHLHKQATRLARTPAGLEGDADVAQGGQRVVPVAQRRWPGADRSRRASAPLDLHPSRRC